MIGWLTKQYYNLVLFRRNFPFYISLRHSAAYSRQGYIATLKIPRLPGSYSDMSVDLFPVQHTELLLPYVKICPYSTLLPSVMMTLYLLSTQLPTNCLEKGDSLLLRLSPGKMWWWFGLLAPLPTTMYSQLRGLPYSYLVGTALLRLFSVTVSRVHIGVNFSVLYITVLGEASFVVNSVHHDSNHCMFQDCLYTHFTVRGKCDSNTSIPITRVYHI